MSNPPTLPLGCRAMPPGDDPFTIRAHAKGANQLEQEAWQSWKEKGQVVLPLPAQSQWLGSWQCRRTLQNPAATFLGFDAPSGASCDPLAGGFDGPAAC